MAEIGNGIKRTFFRGVEALGARAAHMADRARERLKELNAERQIDEILDQVLKAAREAFAMGEPLPEKMTILLSELNRLEAEYGLQDAEEGTAIEEETPDAGEEN
ncbi:MAG: hypothetical protein E7331_08760 [Clostridiales bacterium]|nr:hypothetical protein [Clostridiales bacterium]